MQNGNLTAGVTVDPKTALFIRRIKLSTANLHLQLESQTLLSAIMTSAVTRLRYYYYLILMKKIVEVYEREIVTQLTNTLFGVEQRKASQLISDDLYNISERTTESLVEDYSIPREKLSIPFALGFMYVMEGSKLGGKVIYKHIHLTLGYTENCGAKFIADYGNNTFVLWKEFLSQFSAYITKNDCEEEAIQGAEYAFSSIYDFLELNRLIYEN